MPKDLLSDLNTLNRLLKQKLITYKDYLRIKCNLIIIAKEKIYTSTNHRQCIDSIKNIWKYFLYLF